MLVGKRMLFLYKLFVGKNNIHLSKTVSISEGEIIYAYHDPETQMIYVFTVSGKVYFLNDKHFHSTREVQLVKNEITCVEQLTSTKYLVGSKSVGVDLVDISASPDATDFCKTFFYNLRRIVSVKSLKNKSTDVPIFATRTDQNQLFIWKASETYPTSIVNIDKTVLDVSFYHSLVLTRSESEHRKH